MAELRICTVVVTFNRRPLLERCLGAIAGQTVRPARIVVIDNASTDDTADWIRSSGLYKDARFNYVRMTENLGGAGGFAEGLRRALEFETEWVWMMDDDAVPHPDALERLLEIVTDENNIYGSLAVAGGDTSWATTLLDQGRKVVHVADAVPDVAHVKFIPFLGFLIHRNLVARIGLPDAGYFIAADDVEYCLRAEQVSARVIVAGKSRIEHPKASSYIVQIPGRKVGCLALPPWKRYYDTRNRLLIAKKYYGYRLWTQTVPGSFVRLFGALMCEPRKASQLLAFIAGMTDGLLGRKGRRHADWGIS